MGMFSNFDRFYLEPAHRHDPAEAFRKQPVDDLASVPLDALFADRYGRIYTKTGPVTAAPHFRQRRGSSVPVREIDRSRRYPPPDDRCGLLDAGPYYVL